MAKAPKADLPKDNITPENNTDNAKVLPEDNKAPESNEDSVKTLSEDNKVAENSTDNAEVLPYEDVHWEYWASVRVVNSPYETRRRAGFVFTREPQRIDLNRLTDEQIEAISHDNCLEIKLDATEAEQE